MEDEFLIPPNGYGAGMIKIIGVGESGVNYVNNMVRAGIEGVKFMVCSTDMQTLENSPARVKVHIAGIEADVAADIVRNIAMERSEKMRKFLDDGTKMVIVATNMGENIGAGVTPAITRITKELGMLTVALVTVPSHAECDARFKQAIDGLDKLKHVDALIEININQLVENDTGLTITEIYAEADRIITIAAKDIAELITRTGIINLDFADVSQTLEGGGSTSIGTATAKGLNRAREAVMLALNSPLIKNNDIANARRILMNITTGGGNNELIASELSEIVDFVTGIAKNASMIWAAGNDDTLEDALKITVVATDFVNI